MTWFKVDDNLCTHPKALQAGNAAMGLWVRAGSWSMQNLTDGFIPTEALRSLGTKPQAARLVAANLWAAIPAGWLFHGFNEAGRQPLRAEVEYRRETEAEKKRKRYAAMRSQHHGSFTGERPEVAELDEFSDDGFEAE